MARLKWLFIKSLIFLTLVVHGQGDEYYDDNYNNPIDDLSESDNSNYETGNEKPEEKNETLLEEIIIIGNHSFDLTDLETYNVTIDINLPETKPLKV